MSYQNFFNYHFSEIKDQENFFVNDTNNDAYNSIITQDFYQNIFLFGLKKSGKSHLISIWQKNNDSIIYKNNFDEIIRSNKNVAIDNIFETENEEEIFHIINHCKSFNLKIFVTSSIEINNYNFRFKDLLSRLRSFYFIKIHNPDDEMCKIILTKLFYEKQIIVKNDEIFDYIFNRIKRTYEEIYSIVQKIDKLSLQKKRQLTIPLIKEII